MAARMGVARLQLDPSIEIKADVYDRNKDGAMVCYWCRCSVEGVQSTTRNVDGKQVLVGAYFRLPKHAELKGKGHRPGCRFGVNAWIEKLVAHSREIRSFDGHAELLLASGRGDHAEFRLHIMMEALRRFRSDRSESGSNENGMASQRGARYIPSDRVLRSYLRLAKAVLSLVARVKDRPDLAEHILLKYGSHSIPWDEYFFDVHQYAELHNYLMSHNPTEIHPIAMVLELKEHAVQTPIYRDWSIVGRARVCKHIGGEVAIRPVLYVREEALARRIGKEQFVLVCAIPRLGNIKPSSNPQFKPRLDVRMDVVNHAQICRYEMVE